MNNGRVQFSWYFMQFGPLVGSLQRWILERKNVLEHLMADATGLEIPWIQFSCISVPGSLDVSASMLQQRLKIFLKCNLVINGSMVSMVSMVSTED